MEFVRFSKAFPLGLVMMLFRGGVFSVEIARYYNKVTQAEEKGEAH